MSEFCSKFKNNDGLCISIFHGEFVKFSENLISEWFDVPNEGYKDYIKGRAKLNVNGASNAKILTFFGDNASNRSLDQKDLLSPFDKLLFQLVWPFI